MTARYKGQIVKVIRVEVHRATIVWRGMRKRVNTSDLIDVALIAGLVLSLAALAIAVLR